MRNSQKSDIHPEATQSWSERFRFVNHGAPTLQCYKGISKGPFLIASPDQPRCSATAMGQDQGENVRWLNYDGNKGTVSGDGSAGAATVGAVGLKLQQDILAET